MDSEGKQYYLPGSFFRKKATINLSDTESLIYLVKGDMVF